MGQFQLTALYRKLELDLNIQIGADDPSITEVHFLTDRPGAPGMVIRTLERISTASANAGRQIVRVDLDGATRGRLFQIKIVPPVGTSVGVGSITLYGIKIYAKLLGPHRKTTWQWYTVALEGTSDVWQERRLPIPPTPDTFTEVSLPIRSTPRDPSWKELPVDD